MSISDTLLNGPTEFLTLWIAACWPKRLTKTIILKEDIPNSIKCIIAKDFSLRISCYLLLGCSKILLSKINYCLYDCKYALNFISGTSLKECKSFPKKKKKPSDLQSIGSFNKEVVIKSYRKPIEDITIVDGGSISPASCRSILYSDSNMSHDQFETMMNPLDELSISNASIEMVRKGSKNSYVNDSSVFKLFDETVMASPISASFQHDTMDCSKLDISLCHDTIPFLGECDISNLPIYASRPIIEIKTKVNRKRKLVVDKNNQLMTKPFVVNRTKVKPPNKGTFHSAELLSSIIPEGILDEDDCPLLHAIKENLLADHSASFNYQSMEVFRRNDQSEMTLPDFFDHDALSSVNNISNSRGNMEISDMNFSAKSFNQKDSVQMYDISLPNVDTLTGTREWTHDTSKLLKSFGSLLDKTGEVSFQDQMKRERVSKRSVAKSFYSLMILHRDDYFSLRQEKMFGLIFVKGTSKTFSQLDQPTFI